MNVIEVGGFLVSKLDNRLDINTFGFLGMHSNSRLHSESKCKKK